DPISLVVVNLYPFRETRARGASGAELVEQIDIGGPTMVRAAAKNSAHVGVVVDPDDYDGVLAELEAGQGLGAATRRRLMAKAFAHTASYDAAISEWLSEGEGEAFPPTFNLSLERAYGLRYGENPHQRAAFYREGRAP